MIELRGLQKNYGGLSVVDRINLQIEEGETLVLIGASGCGKTTTLKMINRLVEPSAGEVLIDGQSTRDFVPHELRRRIGYGAQQAGLFPHLNVAQNIGITPRLLGWETDRIAERVDVLLAQVDLDPAVYRARPPASSQAVSSKESAWRARWPRSRTYSCSTNPSEPSIPSLETACRTRCGT